MHPIQRYILRQLMLNEVCRYSQLKPEDIDGNQFMYHFTKLVQQELVQKVESGYSLTFEGRRNASRLSMRSMELRLQPSVATVIACQNERGEWLLHRRAYHPFLGRKSFPYGKLHWGESLAESAVRELKDKTGLLADLELRGDMYLRVFEGNQLMVHMLCHLFYATNPHGDLKVEGEKGACCWEKVGKDESEYLPGFHQMVSIIENGQTGCLKEIVVHLPGEEVVKQTEE